MWELAARGGWAIAGPVAWSVMVEFPAFALEAAHELLTVGGRIDNERPNVLAEFAASLLG